MFLVSFMWFEMSVRKCYLCGAKPPIVSLHAFPKENDALCLWKTMCKLKTFDTVSTLKICSQHFLPSDYINFNAKEFGGTLRLLRGSYPSVNVPNKKVSSLSLMPKHAADKMDVTTLRPNKTVSLLSLMPKHAADKMDVNTLDLNKIVSLDSLVPEHTADKMDVTKPEPSKSSTSKTVCLDEENDPDNPNKKKFLDSRYLSQVKIPDFSTPRKASRILKLAKECFRRERLKGEALRQKNRRLLNKISTLEEMLEHLKKNSDLSEDSESILIRISN